MNLLLRFHAPSVRSHMKAVEKKALCSRREPKNDDQQSNEEKDLQQANLQAEQWRAPGEGNSEAVDGADSEENKHRHAQDRGDDGDKVRVEFETAEGAPYHPALQNPGDEETQGNQPDKGGDAENRDVVAGEIKQRVARPSELHGASFDSGRALRKAGKQKTRPKPCLKIPLINRGRTRYSVLALFSSMYFTTSPTV